MPPCVWASEVAAVVGRHRYRPAPEAIGRLLAREFAREPARAPAPEFAPAPELAEAAHARLLDGARSALQADAALRDAVAAGERIDPRAVAGLAPPLQAEIAHQSRMAHGTLREQACLDEMQAKLGCALHSHQQKYRRELRTPAGHRFALFAKIDALQTRADGQQVVVETKQRNSRLFRRVPEYELVQIHACMFLAGLNQGILNESFGGQSLQHPIEFDARLWRRVQEELCDAVDRCWAC